jgi:hypothetical protein
MKSLPLYEICFHCQMTHFYNFSVNKHYIMKPNGTPFKVYKKLNSNVGLLNLFPTITPCMVSVLDSKAI